MKPMRKIKYYLVAFAAITLIILGCSRGKKQNYGTDSAMPDSAKTIEQTTAVDKESNDSTENNGNENVNKLIRNHTDNIKLLKEEVKQEKTNEVWQWLGIIFAILEGILILCLVIVLFKKDAGLTRRIRSHEKIIGDLQHKDGLNDLNAVSKPVSGYTPSYYDYQDIKDRIAKLENALSSLQSPQPTIVKKEVAETHSAPTTSNIKICYFGSPISGDKPYFKKEISSKNEDARFQVEIEGVNANFTPFNDSQSINTYKSTDALRAVIDFDGDNDGGSSIVKITPGKAKKQDDRWIVVEKAKIKLS